MDRVDAKLVTELADQHGAALVLYAQQWCESPEDVVQEAFLALVRQAQRPENPVGWLYRVVRNGAISVSRSATRRMRRETRLAGRGEPWFETAAEDRLDAKTVTAALRELPLDQRETIVARLWGGLSLEEVAVLSEVSIATAHRRFQAGLAALRERLGVPCVQKT